MKRPAKKTRVAGWMEAREQARAKYLKPKRGIAIRIVVIQVQETDEGTEPPDFTDIPECMR